jgi:hypothetical protein
MGVETAGVEYVGLEWSVTNVFVSLLTLSAIGLVCCLLLAGMAWYLGWLGRTILALGNTSSEEARTSPARGGE